MVERIRRREQQIYVFRYIHIVPNQSIDRSIACFLFFCCCPEYVPTCTFPGPRPQATAAAPAASFLLTKKRRLLKECVSDSKNH